MLGRWIVSGRARQAIDWMPLLDPAALADGPELRRAMLLLSFLGPRLRVGGSRPRAAHPRVHRRAVARGRRAARPAAGALLRVVRARQLAAARSRAGRSRSATSRCSRTSSAARTRSGSSLVHVDDRGRGGARARRASSRRCAAARRRRRWTKLQRPARVHRARDSSACARSLARMPECCDPAIYYRRVRPYIHGWKNHPVLPDGVIYEGVDALRGQARSASAARPARRARSCRCSTRCSASRTPTIRCAIYLSEMRDYMPPAQRAFVADRRGGLGRAPLRDSRTARARRRSSRAYDACVAELARFRDAAPRVRRALHPPARRRAGAANPTGVGTGGTPFMSYLLKHRDETERQRIGAGPAA